MKTCENCRYDKRRDERAFIAHDECIYGWAFKGWRPRRWVPVLICALVGLALTVAACIVWACLDQARINARPRPEAQAHDFQFYEKIPVRIEDRVTWMRGETVVWTIYSVVGPSDGYAISKGEE